MDCLKFKKKMFRAWDSVSGNVSVCSVHLAGKANGRAVAERFSA